MRRSNQRNNATFYIMYEFAFDLNLMESIFRIALPEGTYMTSSDVMEHDISPPRLRLKVGD